MDKGIFTVSIDFESAWGYVDHDLNEEDKKRIEKETEIVSRLLDLFDRYRISATWAVVGHLLDRGCTWDGEKSHPEYPPLVYKDNEIDWFKHHPAAHDYKSKLWFDEPNLISRIRHGRTKHEVASHSYAHILYDENKTYEEAIKADLKNLGRVHRVHDVPLTSFVFPRNVEGFHRLLKLNGFTTYRGNSPKWYDDQSDFAKRMARLIDYFLPVGRTVKPDTSKYGLINIPDSMLLIGRNGLRSLVRPGIVTKKAKRGLEKAVKKNEVFHLWFHPSNFSYKTEEQFKIFEDILKEVSKLSTTGKLEVKTMQQIAKNIQHESNNS